MDAFALVGGSRIEQKPKPLFGFSHAIVSAKVSVRGDLVALLFYLCLVTYSIIMATGQGLPRAVALLLFCQVIFLVSPRVGHSASSVVYSE